MTHTIAKGCGCDLCKQPFEVPPFPGLEENTRRQEAYATRRRATAAANGISTDRQAIRGKQERQF